MSLKKNINLITELERRYLECSICTEVFDEKNHIPRLLPCLHQFCSECLKILCHQKSSIKCPTCNAVHRVKKTSPLNFPKDNTRRDLTSFLQTLSDENSFTKCGKCGNTMDVTYKCQECTTNLCESCRQQHEIENITHTIVVNRSEVFRDEADDLDICQNPLHERSKLKHFCNSSNCQSVLCPSCALNEHRDKDKHELEDIKDAFEKRKSELSQDVESLQSQILRILSILQNVQHNTNILRNESKEFHRNVDVIYHRGIQVLEDRRKVLLEKYNTVFQREESKAISKTEYLDSCLTNATECCNLSEQLMNCDNMSSFLNVHQTVNVHMKQNLNTPFEDLTTNDAAGKRINFDNYLRLFRRSVENIEIDEENDDIKTLIGLDEENFQKGYVMDTIITFGKCLLNRLGTMFRYSTHKVRQFVLYVFVYMCMVHKVRLMLGQLLNINPGNLQDMPPHDDQNIRQVRRNTLGRNQYLYDRQHLGLEHIHGYVVGFNVIIWHIMIQLIIILIIIKIILIPLSIRENGNLIALQFNNQMASQFKCRSADNQTVATKPLNNIWCFSTGRLFKYKGVFANKSFLPETETSLEFSITLQPQNTHRYDQVTVFEFGLTQDSISTEVLFPSIISVSAFTCPNIFGLCLVTGNSKFLRNEDIFSYEHNSSIFEGRFILYYRPSDFVLLILAKYPKTEAKIELDRIPNVIFTRPFWPVFSAYSPDRIATTITLKTNGFDLDRLTLHSHLFISDDNKTMSSTRLSVTRPSNIFESPFIYTLPKRIEISKTIQTMINVEFVESNSGDTLFKIGLKGSKDGIHKATSLLKCVKCEVKYLFGFYRTNGYCLSFDNDTHLTVVRNEFSFFLHYHTNGIIEFYILNKVSGYTYCFFQFHPFLYMTPEFYIEQVDAEDIIISSNQDADILNLGRLCLVLCIFAFLFRIQTRQLYQLSLVIFFNVLISCFVILDGLTCAR